MVTYGGITFNGKSGEKYYFKAWPLNTKFNPLGAVYFVTKRAFNDKTYRRASHQSIYIGQTADQRHRGCEQAPYSMCWS